MQKVLVATRNPGKMREYADLLADLPAEWVLLADVGIDFEVEETGATFEENARLKAIEYGAASGLLTMADDSGLEVDYLGRLPGVRSARYGGPDLDDEGRYRLLLERLEGVPDEQRTARFRCVIAARMPEGEIVTAEGSVEGRIAHEPRGEHGFGYDPVFYLPELGQTMAELPAEQKNRISHRAVALAVMRPMLETLLG